MNKNEYITVHACCVHCNARCTLCACATNTAGPVDPSCEPLHEPTQGMQGNSHLLRIYVPSTAGMRQLAGASCSWAGAFGSWAGEIGQGPLAVGLGPPAVGFGLHAIRLGPLAVEQGPQAVGLGPRQLGWGLLRLGRGLWKRTLSTFKALILKTTGPKWPKFCKNVV